VPKLVPDGGKGGGGDGLSCETLKFLYTGRGGRKKPESRGKQSEVLVSKKRQEVTGIEKSRVRCRERSGPERLTTCVKTPVESHGGVKSLGGRGGGGQLVQSVERTTLGRNVENIIRRQGKPGQHRPRAKHRQERLPTDHRKGTSSSVLAPASTRGTGRKVRGIIDM